MHRLLAIAAFVTLGCGGASSDPPAEAKDAADVGGGGDDVADTAPPACPDGDVGCGCLSDGSCHSGGSCLSGTCVACAAGTKGCPCAEGNTCDAGLDCRNDGCYPDTCKPGREDCPCEAGACAPGLQCGGDGTCRPCNAGVAGCPCALGLCTGGLVCDGALTCRAAKACAESGCAAHQLCVEASLGKDAACAPACEAGYVFSGGLCADAKAASCATLAQSCGALHRSCAETPSGPACAACLPGYLDEGKPACRAIVTCAALQCADELRQCDPATATADAHCGPCQVGAVEQQGVCVPKPSSCDPKDPDSIAPECAALHRSCDAAPLPHCGACLAGEVPSVAGDAASACRLPLLCAELSCLESEVCEEGEGVADATCVARPCASPTEALNESSGQCVDCTKSKAFCGVDGETGGYWSTTLAGTNECLCETTTGYYADEGKSKYPKRCDADGDGWTAIGARDALQSPDPAIRKNARCHLRTIDRFVLENEYGQSRAVWSCDATEPLALEAWPVTGASPCPGDTKAIALYEPLALDDQDALTEAGTDAPPWTDGDAGRSLRAEELNPLTKACVTTSADHNANGLSDVSEHHRNQQGDPLDTDLRLFIRMAYFLETTRGRYESPASGDAPGSYRIVERRRCIPGDLPVSAEPTADAYWRSCTRNRDSAWTIDEKAFSPVGFDFAEYACGAPAGTCPTPPPLVAVSGPILAVPPHGLCEVGEVPEDAPWMGLTAHSQLKCVVVQDQPGDALTSPQVVVKADLYDGSSGKLVLNRCHVDCAGDECADADEPLPTAEANSLTPKIACTPLTDASGVVVNATVGFAVVRFVDSPGAYQRGCIDEFTPSNDLGEQAMWRSLCPGYLEAPEATDGFGSPGRSGRITCGCGLHYGGAACDVPCAEPMWGGAATGDPSCFDGYCPVVDQGEGPSRLGVWMCAEVVATGPTEASLDVGPLMTPIAPLEGDAPSLFGAITLSPQERSPLCGPDGCEKGPSVR